MKPTAWSGYLEFDQVSFSWPNGVNVINQCSFSILKPGLWMLVGENGSGKSTLFRLINGGIRPKSGKIFCSLRPSMVYQNPDHQLLMPTCKSELMLSVPKTITQTNLLDLIHSALEKVDLGEMLDRPIHTLSGGQKQRLALAGAIVSNSNLLLLDEPTALLDPQSQNSVLKVMKKIRQVPLLIQLQQYGLLIDWKNYIFVMERQLLKMELSAIGILVQKCSKN